MSEKPSTATSFEDKMPRSQRWKEWAGHVPLDTERHWLFGELEKRATKALKIEGEAKEIVARLIEVNVALDVTEAETMEWLTRDFVIAHPDAALAARTVAPSMRDAEIVRRLRELFDFPPDDHRTDGGMRHCRCYYAVREMLESTNAK